jgi:hypothetical protein
MPRHIQPSPATRGIDNRRWPVEMIIKRGYAVATAYYGDIEPAYPGGWRYGVRPASAALPVSFLRLRFGRHAGPSYSLPEDWGALAVRS